MGHPKREKHVYLHVRTRLPKGKEARSRDEKQHWKRDGWKKCVASVAISMNGGRRASGRAYEGKRALHSTHIYSREADLRTNSREAQASFVLQYAAKVREVKGVVRTRIASMFVRCSYNFNTVSALCGVCDPL